jgi:serine/threonine protein kinase/predicted esterase
MTEDKQTSERKWALVKRILDTALGLSPVERDRYLDNACEGDNELRDEIDSLLSHEDSKFLEVPAVSNISPGSSDPQLQLGTLVDRYEILSLIGVGGMGEVYRATDTKLNRPVAIKILPSRLADHSERRRRFDREAQVISKLNHPNICTLHDVGSFNEIDYLVMEYIEGETLAEKLKAGALPVATALDYAEQILRGLAKAHEAGIVHRDLKPDNVMLTREGVKLLDFGLAKFTGVDFRSVSASVQSTLAGDPGASTKSIMTQHGAVLGTVPYMAPEQIKGRAATLLSDQFSFGATFYEMLSGERAFHAGSATPPYERILHGEPAPLRDIRPEVDDEIAQTIERCLQKEPEDRFPSTHDLQNRVTECRARLDAGNSRPSLRRIAITVGALLAVVAGSALFAQRGEFLRWIERDTLVLAEQFVETGELNQAYRLLQGLRRKLPGDAVVQSMFERFTIPVNVVSDPPGARVRVRDYASVDVPWIELGATPLQGVRIPYALMEWTITKPGYEPFNGAPFGNRPFSAFANGLTLRATGDGRPGMVRIPGGPFQRQGFPPVVVGDYWLDTYEVSNERYQRFVDANGYANSSHWADLFAVDSTIDSPDSLLTGFVDRSGSPGPAGWTNGEFEQGSANFPVSGVSWYEAAAFCRFEGKQLPTLFHWSAATIQYQVSDIVNSSNFEGQGPQPAGQQLGMSDFGSFDMAGNVAEWVWNEAQSGRYRLGGSWKDPSYTFQVDADSRPATSRDETSGFRCAEYDAPPDAALLQRYVHYRDDAKLPTVSDEIYAAYSRMYTYDRTDLDATLDNTDDSSPHWRRETVSFAAAYGGERVLAHLFIPRDAEPPYQSVIWVPGNDALYLPPGGALASPYLFDFIPQNGRVLVYPVFKGTYERHIPFSFAPNEWRDLIVAWSKDLSRTVDYLEEREDFDAENIAYYGFSAGAVYAPIFTAVDPRFRASILLAAGLKSDFAPEVNITTFASRSYVPSLMINGQNDFISRLESSQLPLLDMLGAGDADKKHVRLAGGHIVSDRTALKEEVLGWLDRYLGEPM